MVIKIHSFIHSSVIGQSETRLTFHGGCTVHDS